MWHLLKTKKMKRKISNVQFLPISQREIKQEEERKRERKKEDGESCELKIFLFQWIHFDIQGIIFSYMDWKCDFCHDFYYELDSTDCEGCGKVFCTGCEVECECEVDRCYHEPSSSCPNCNLVLELEDRNLCYECAILGNCYNLEYCLAHNSLYEKNKAREEFHCQCIVLSSRDKIQEELDPKIFNQKHLCFKQKPIDIGGVIGGGVGRIE